MDNYYIAVIALGVLIVCMVFFRKKPEIKAVKPKLGIRGAHMIYTDQKENDKQEDIVYGKILHSEKYDIQGKPDYIFRTRYLKDLIPMELKSGSVDEEDPTPFPGDLLQLAAYFLIVEEVYEKRPKEGRLLYSNCMFIVRNTRRLRRQVKHTLHDMRDMLKTGEQEVDPSFVKCRHCICRDTVCEYAKDSKK